MSVSVGMTEELLPLTRFLFITKNNDYEKMVRDVVGNIVGGIMYTEWL